MSLPLSSSARTKRRYLHILGTNKSAVERVMLAGLGTIGWSRAAPVFVTSSNLSGVVVSVDRRSLDAVRAALELAPERMKITRVSGTIKGLNK